MRLELPAYLHFFQLILDGMDNEHPDVVGPAPAAAPVAPVAGDDTPLNRRTQVTV